jgi:hypothetical protein
MLEHTFDQIEKVIPARRLFSVVNQDPLNCKEARQQISARPPGTVIVPDKDTAPAILLALLRIHKQYDRSALVSPRGCVEYDGSHGTFHDAARFAEPHRAKPTSLIDGGLDGVDTPQEETLLKEIYASLEPTSFFKSIPRNAPVYEPGCLSLPIPDSFGATGDRRAGSWLFWNKPAIGRGYKGFPITVI